ncbi:hypothetical protein Tco_0407202 [Tanacetum coccineum]
MNMMTEMMTQDQQKDLHEMGDTCNMCTLKLDLVCINRRLCKEVMKYDANDEYDEKEECHERGFEFVGSEGKNVLEVEEGMKVLSSIMIDRVEQSLKKVVEVVDWSFYEASLPWKSSRDEAQWGSFDEMLITFVLANFLGGFLVEEDALEAILKVIKKGVVADFSQLI